MARKNDNMGRNFALSALVGAAAGYITGLLTAPKSGRATRHDIADKVDDIKEGAEDQLQDLSDELKDLINEAKERTMSLNAKAREEFNEAVIKAKDAQSKATAVLKAVKAGEAEDPELNKAVKQAKQAKSNLAKFFRG